MASTYTYDNTLATNKDHVRFLIGDTDTSNGKLTDEEINAVITEETTNGASGASLKYFAAATCLAALYAKWASSGKGITEKEVEDLRLKYGMGGSAAEVIKAAIEDLRATGARLLSPSPYLFKSL